MPQVLSMTPKQDESPEDFAARVGEQVSQFFQSTGGSTESTGESTEPAPEAGDETSSGSDAPTDVSAGGEEPAPSA